MKKSIICLLILSANLNFSLAQTWKSTSASISFTIKHAFGATAEGSFKGFESTLIFDPNNPANASVRGSIDTKTINTGIGLRDNTLRGTSYFDIEQYPKISMTSTKIEKGTQEHEYIGYFSLTIKKTTKAIRLPFTFVQNGVKGTFKGSFMINRIDYGIGDKSSLLSDTVSINLVIQTQQL